MRKTKALLIVILCCLLISAFALTACDNDGQNNIPRFTVTVQNGTINDSGTTATVEVGTLVTVTATVPDGKQFVAWYEGSNRVHTANPYIFAVERHTTLTATFEDIPAFPLHFSNPPNDINELYNLLVAEGRWHYVYIEFDNIDTTNATGASFITYNDEYFVPHYELMCIGCDICGRVLDPDGIIVFEYFYAFYFTNVAEAIEMYNEQFEGYAEIQMMYDSIGAFFDFAVWRNGTIVTIWQITSGTVSQIG